MQNSNEQRFPKQKGEKEEEETIAMSIAKLYSPGLDCYAYSVHNLVNNNNNLIINPTTTITSTAAATILIAK